MQRYSAIRKKVRKNEMPSRLCGVCSKCSNIANCDNKRMEALAYLTPTTNATINVTINNNENLDIEKLTKQIEKSINSKMKCGFII